MSMPAPVIAEQRTGFDVMLHCPGCEADQELLLDFENLEFLCRDCGDYYKPETLLALAEEKAKAAQHEADDFRALVA